MHRVDPIVVHLASRQHGVVAHHQITRMGAPPSLAHRRVRSGHWERIAPGVYRIGGAPPTYEQRVMSAVLSAGEGAAASHRTAMRLSGVPLPGSTPVEISIPRSRSLRRRGVIVHRSRDLHLADIRSVSGIPTTGPARTVLDVAALDPDRTVRIVSLARRSLDVEWDDLLRVLSLHARRGRTGVRALRQVVAEHYGTEATDSTTEDRAELLLRRAGLVPLPDRQVKAMCADGVEVTADFGWPRYRALLEVYGGPHFDDEGVMQMDLHRRNQLELAGYRILVYSGYLLARQPDQFLSDVLDLLESQGYDPAAPEGRAS